MDGFAGPRQLRRLLDAVLSVGGELDLPTVLRRIVTAATDLVDARYGTESCDMYRDFRDLLDRSDIDAVLIATGPNWHATAAINAAKAGKDMYCEKPCTKNIAQSLTLADVMRHKYGQNMPPIIYTSPTEAFFVRVKLAFFGALVVAFPLLAGQIWAFVAPGLYKHERSAFLPFLLATPVLFLLGATLLWWRQRDALIGNVVGAGLIGICVLLFIWREYLELGQVRAACGEQNIACRFRPTDFNRYAIYGAIRFAQVMAVFVIGLSVEERARRRTRRSRSSRPGDRAPPAGRR